MATPFDLDDVPTSPPPRRPVPRGVSLVGVGFAVFLGVLAAECVHTVLAALAVRWLVLRAVGQ